MVGASGGLEHHLLMADLQGGIPGQLTSSSGNMDYLIARNGLFEHFIPQIAFLCFTLARLSAADQKLRAAGICNSLLKKLVDVLLPVSNTDQHRIGAKLLDFTYRPVAVEPLDALLLFDGQVFAAMILADILTIPGPALHIEQPKGNPLLAEGHRVMEIGRAHV